MIAGMIRLFVKGVVKSSVSSAVIAGAFIVGREYGKFDVEKKMKIQSDYYEMELEKEGYPNPSRRER